MKLSHNEQWVFSLLSLMLVIAVVLLVESHSLYPEYFLSTLVIVGAGLLLLVNHRFFSPEVIGFVIIFFPALSPVYAWTIEGKELFSLAARHLQYDIDLVNKTVYLFAVAATMYSLIAAPRVPHPKGEAVGAPRRGVMPDAVLYVIAGLTMVSSFAIEAGPTILTADYDAVLNSRLERSTAVVFFVSLFGGLWGLLFAYGRHNRWLFWGVTLFVCLWLTLHSRRVEVTGIAIVLILWGQYRLKSRSLVLLVGAFLILQIAIGVARHSGVLEYLTSGEDVSKKALMENKAALPGGAANVFLAGLHLVDVKDGQVLNEEEELTMLQWPLSLVPNFILRSVGFPAAISEHESVFEELELDYVGGMPLLAVFYLNGGVVLVMLFGVIHAALARRIGWIIDRDLAPRYFQGGTFGLFVVTVFLMYQFRYHWYNPFTMFRVVELAVVLFVILVAFIGLIRSGRRSDPSRGIFARPNG